MSGAHSQSGGAPPDSAAARYAGTWGEQYHHSKRSIPEAAFPWIARLRAEKFAPWVTESATLLEYGVGYGWNLGELRCARKLGHDVAAFLAPELRAHGIEFVPDTRSVPAGSIAVVICHHTLEHVLQPPEVLQEIRRLLRPEGTLLLHVPFEKERRYRSYNPAEPNQHLYSWNVQTLSNLTTLAGFTIVDARVGRFGYDRFAAQWAVKLRLGEAGFRLVRNLVHLIRPGHEVRVVARKRRDPEARK